MLRSLKEKHLDEYRRRLSLFEAGTYSIAWRLLCRNLCSSTLSHLLLSKFPRLVLAIYVVQPCATDWHTTLSPSVFKVFQSCQICFLFSGSIKN